MVAQEEKEKKKQQNKRVKCYVEQIVTNTKEKKDENLTERIVEMI